MAGYRLTRMKDEFDKEIDEYSVLREYFDKIDADLGRAKDENQILAAVARRESFAFKVFDLAANRIQNIARGNQARSRIAHMKKGKKGKGGKGKKRPGKNARRR